MPAARGLHESLDETRARLMAGPFSSPDSCADAPPTRVEPGDESPAREERPVGAIDREWHRDLIAQWRGESSRGE